MGDENMKALEASYSVTYLIANSRGAEVIGETLVKPAAKVMVQAMIRDKASKAINRVPLSNNTVHCRITDMAENVKQQLLSRVQRSRYYALQADESTDVVNLANLLLFVRYELNNEVHNDILFCQSMPTHTTGEAIFKVIDDFIKNSDLDWSRCVGISMDGARAMIGSKKGVVARIQAVAPEAKSTHCCIHREALATQNVQADLKKVLDEAVKIINFVKGRPLNAWLFSQLCDEMGSDYTQLLFHTEVHWLSRGKVLSRLFELREELQVFLDETFNLRDHIHDWKLLCKLAYLADIFAHLNNLNLSLQGKLISILHVQDKVSAMVAKLKLWHTRLSHRELDSFPSLHT
ncbi:zinc finger BED domain-containing protein 5-like [Trachemys scripta elegans]|uniref:zinc finger BED domain-containing protein 5-like n=1 Tax=Trachemys scripta elegans TaxID=31138 RepID=UPI001551AE9D|nr:zinc finger BED domain-containing protein 5-like [Trachemys scripta elegans]